MILCNDPFKLDHVPFNPQNLITEHRLTIMVNLYQNIEYITSPWTWLLPPPQIIGCFSFSRYMAFAFALRYLLCLDT